MPVYDFAVGQTNPETFPVEAFKQAAMRAIDAEHDNFNRYPGNNYGRKGKQAGRRTCGCRADRNNERLHAGGDSRGPGPNAGQRR